MKNKYIEDRKEYWGPEFAALANVEYKPEHDEIASMGAYTMLYEIADNFKDGEFREEILKMFSQAKQKKSTKSLEKQRF